MQRKSIEPVHFVFDVHGLGRVLFNYHQQAKWMLDRNVIVVMQVQDALIGLLCIDMTSFMEEQLPSADYFYKMDDAWSLLHYNHQLFFLEMLLPLVPIIWNCIESL